MVSVEKYYELHQTVKVKLLANPERVISRALSNISRWESNSEYISPWLIEWRSILNEGVDAIVAVFEGMDGHSADLRKNSPFSGILTEEERLEILFDDAGTRAQVMYLSRQTGYVTESIERSSSTIE